MATQTAKDVADVVARGYPTRKCAVPVGEDAADDLDAGGVEVGDGDVEAVLVGVREVFPVGAGGGRAVEVGAWCIFVSRDVVFCMYEDVCLYQVDDVGVNGGVLLTCTHGNDTAEVNEPFNRCPHQYLERRIVFLCAHAIDSCAIGPQRCRVFKRLCKPATGIIDIARSAIALDDAGRHHSRVIWRTHFRIQEAVFARLLGVLQLGSLGKSVGGITQVGVELEDFGAVRDAGVLEGVGTAVRDVTRGPVLGQRSGVDFVLESDLDGIPSKGDAADGCMPWIHARDAC